MIETPFLDTPNCVVLTQPQVLSANAILSHGRSTDCGIGVKFSFERKKLLLTHLIIVLQFDMTRTECKSAAKVIGCINLIEIHPWIGTSIVHRRRDQRRGPAQCWVERYDGGFVMRWEGFLFVIYIYLMLFNLINEKNRRNASDVAQSSTGGSFLVDALLFLNS